MCIPSRKWHDESRDAVGEAQHHPYRQPRLFWDFRTADFGIKTGCEFSQELKLLAYSVTALPKPCTFKAFASDIKQIKFIAE